jgi:hypothetical protein
MLTDEPEGWNDLQEMAQRERNPKRLVAIIDQMNRLLDEQEHRTSGTMRARSDPSARVPESVSE